MTPLLFGREMTHSPIPGGTEYTANLAGLRCVVEDVPGKPYRWRIDAWGMATHAHGEAGLLSLAVAKIEKRIMAVCVAVKRERW